MPEPLVARRASQGADSPRPATSPIWTAASDAPASNSSRDFAADYTSRCTSTPDQYPRQITLRYRKSSSSATKQQQHHHLWVLFRASPHIQIQTIFAARQLLKPTLSEYHTGALSSRLKTHRCCGYWRAARPEWAGGNNAVVRVNRCKCMDVNDF